MIKNTNTTYDVAGVGSALLDIIVDVEHEMLETMGLSLGEMKLIDGDESRRIMKVIGEMHRDKVPGGSAANTLAGVANIGGTGILIGSVGTDEYGDLYQMETREGGIEPLMKKHEGITGHAITFITPDSERTFATHLGAATELGPDDITVETISKAKILHLEGYLLEPAGLKEAALKAIKIAKENDVLVSLDLSDPALIGRIKDTFKEVVPSSVDILFANETEAQAYTGKEEKEALEILAREVPFAVVKVGERGSFIKTAGEVFTIPGFKVKTVNTNGAGDMYAAGVLYGICRGYEPQKAGTIGSYAASLVVAQHGARLMDPVEYSSVV